MDKDIVLLNENGELDKSTATNILEVQNKIKELNESLDNVKELIKSEMERLGLLRIEVGDGIYIDYYPDSAVETFDSKKFKEENYDLYRQYTKTSPKKAFVKIAQKKTKIER